MKPSTEFNIIIIILIIFNTVSGNLYLKYFNGHKKLVKRSAKHTEKSKQSNSIMTVTPLTVKKVVDNYNFLFPSSVYQNNAKVSANSRSVDKYVVRNNPKDGKPGVIDSRRLRKRQTINEIPEQPANVPVFFVQADDIDIDKNIEPIDQDYFYNTRSNYEQGRKNLEKAPKTHSVLGKLEPFQTIDADVKRKYYEGLLKALSNDKRTKLPHFDPNQIRYFQGLHRDLNSRQTEEANPIAEFDRTDFNRFYEDKLRNLFDIIPILKDYSSRLKSSYYLNREDVNRLTKIQDVINLLENLNSVKENSRNIVDWNPISSMSYDPKANNRLDDQISLVRNRNRDSLNSITPLYSNQRIHILEQIKPLLEKALDSINSQALDSNGTPCPNKITKSTLSTEPEPDEDLDDDQRQIADQHHSSDGHRKHNKGRPKTTLTASLTMCTSPKPQETNKKIDLTVDPNQTERHPLVFDDELNIMASLTEPGNSTIRHSKSPVGWKESFVRALKLTTQLDPRESKCTDVKHPTTEYLKIESIKEANNVRDKRSDELAIDERERVKQEAAITEFLKKRNKILEKFYHKNSVALWEFEINMNSKTSFAAIRSELELAEVRRDTWIDAKNITQCGSFKDKKLSRQLKLLSVIGEPGLPDNDFLLLQSIIANMTQIYSSTTLCEYSNCNNCGLTLDADIRHLMAQSTDYDELLHYWKLWRKKTGNPTFGYFTQYVSITRHLAHLNDFNDPVKYWLHEYDDPNIEQIAEKLFHNFQPFYKEFHTYVRYKLQDVYGDDLVPACYSIPAHLLGNMWAQDWSNIYSITVPFPNASRWNIDIRLKEKNYTIYKLAKTAEDFFLSLGLVPLNTTTFWEKSILEVPKEKQKIMVCHASAWDMFLDKDFRIKMCGQPVSEDFKILHHEMGHIYYYLYYVRQPFVFRTGANPAFHEAIGDTIALSAMTVANLERIGLYTKLREEESIEEIDSDVVHKSIPTVTQCDINHLYRIALEKVAFIPFAYAVERWRWDVFRDVIPQKDYNDHWWKLRETFQGIRRPIPPDRDDFDPTSKFHIAANVPYFRYFLSYIMQFQFHKALCTRSDVYNHNDPNSFFKCNIYGNKEAGTLLADILRLGASQPWSYVLQVFTGTKEISVLPLLEYFHPLHQWLQKENIKLSKDGGKKRRRKKRQKV